ncbi:hypothetical protein ZWY2020_026212 [Hordeum vulgare]|nr:hypothetical protein ZWY2020_026212 [Hordeum vulgare]
MDLEDGGVVVAADRGSTFTPGKAMLVACMGSAWVVTGVLMALWLCCVHEDAAIRGCQCRRDLMGVVAGGVLVVVGCGVWVCLALRFCCCCWRSGWGARIHGVLMLCNY